MNDIELNKVYEEFYLRNPNKGHKVLSSQFLEKLPDQIKSCHIIFPSWFTKEEFDITLTSKQAKNYLNTLGLNIQNYYDIVVLGLMNIESRPRCVCGNLCPFKGFSVGYSKYCCKKHAQKYREIPESFIIAGRTSKLGKKTSEEVKRKISESEKRTKSTRIYKPTPETLAKLSKAKRGRPKSRIWKQHMSESALRRIKENPEKALSNLKGTTGMRGGNISLYSCKKAGGKIIRCLSSWEERFLRLCDENLKYVISVDTYGALDYVDPLGKNRLYIPDFFLKLDTGTNVLVEIKPLSFKYEPLVLSKKKAALKYCRQNNMKYVILTEKEIFLKKGSYFNIFDFIF